MGIKMKPCPFCGQASPNIHTSKFSARVSCVGVECNCSISANTGEKAIRAWNRRAGRKEQRRATH